MKRLLLWSRDPVVSMLFQNEMHCLMERYSVNESLVEEIERLKEENRRLRTNYWSREDPSGPELSLSGSASSLSKLTFRLEVVLAKRVSTWGNRVWGQNFAFLLWLLLHEEAEHNRSLFSQSGWTAATPPGAVDEGSVSDASEAEERKDWWNKSVKHLVVSFKKKKNRFWTLVRLRVTVSQ